VGRNLLGNGAYRTGPDKLQVIEEWRLLGCYAVWFL
jgi:hypothetical protein